MTRFNSWLVFLLIAVAKVDSNSEWYRVLHQDLESSPKCVLNPCRNGGSCTAYQDRFHCTCKTGWIGNNCERHSSCSPNPCVHGDCSANLESYTCTCKPGYKGKHCDVVQRCHPNPCLNGGSCTEAGYNVYCECLAGFKGRLCEYEAKCAPLNPCMNGGSCQEKSDKYYCVCGAPYMGDNCELFRTPTRSPPTISIHVEGPQAIPSPEEDGDSMVSRIAVSRFTNNHPVNEAAQPVRNIPVDSDKGIPSFTKSVFSPSKYDPPPFGKVSGPVQKIYNSGDLPQQIQNEIKSEKYATLNTTVFLQKNNRNETAKSGPEKEKHDEADNAKTESHDITGKINGSNKTHEENVETSSKNIETKKDDSIVNIAAPNYKPEANVNDHDNKNIRATLTSLPEAPAGHNNNTTSNSNADQLGTRPDRVIGDVDATKRSDLIKTNGRLGHVNRFNGRKHAGIKSNKSSKNIFFRNSTYDYILNQSDYEVKGYDLDERSYDGARQNTDDVNTIKNKDVKKRSDAHANKTTHPRVKKLPDVNGQLRSGVSLLLTRGLVINDSRNKVTKPVNTSIVRSKPYQKLKARGNVSLRNESKIPGNATGVHGNKSLEHIIRTYSDKVKILTNIINIYSADAKNKNLISHKKSSKSRDNAKRNNTSSDYNVFYILPQKDLYTAGHASRKHHFLYALQNFPYTATGVPKGTNLFRSPHEVTTYNTSKKHKLFYSPRWTPSNSIKREEFVNLAYEIHRPRKEEIMRNYDNSSRLFQENPSAENRNNSCPKFCKTFCDPWCAKLGCCVVSRDQMELIRNIEKKNSPAKARTSGSNCPKCHHAAYCLASRCVCQKGYFGDGYVCKSENLKYSLCSKCHRYADCIGGDCFCTKEFFGNGNKCWPLPIPIE